MFSAQSIGMCRSAAQEVGRFAGPRSCVSQRNTFHKETRGLRWTGASSKSGGHGMAIDKKLKLVMPLAGMEERTISIQDQGR